LLLLLKFSFVARLELQNLFLVLLHQINLKMF